MYYVFIRKLTYHGGEGMLKFEVLQKALYDLVNIKGIVRQEITRVSNVHNIVRIISGDIKPMFNSWVKLHN